MDLKDLRRGRKLMPVALSFFQLLSQQEHHTAFQTSTSASTAAACREGRHRLAPQNELLPSFNFVLTIAVPSFLETSIIDILGHCHILGLAWTP